MISQGAIRFKHHHSIRFHGFWHLWRFGSIHKHSVAMCSERVTQEATVWTAFIGENNGILRYATDPHLSPSHSGREATCSNHRVQITVSPSTVSIACIESPFLDAKFPLQKLHPHRISIATIHGKISTYLYHFHCSKSSISRSTGHQAAFYAWRRRAKRQREVLSILLKQVEQIRDWLVVSKI